MVIWVLPWVEELSVTVLVLGPYASPLRAPNLHGLPRATVITAEVDPLRDQGEGHALRLNQAGVEAMLTRDNGVTQEFFSMTGVIGTAKDAGAEAAAGLKTACSCTADHPYHHGHTTPR